MPLYAGVGETNITPPPDVWMAGYSLRSSPAVGVHDDLFARALVLDDGEFRMGLVAMDLVSLDFELVQRIREGVSAQAGIPGEALLLNATHTHGGPGTRIFRTCGPPDPIYREIVVRKIIGVVKQAAGKQAIPPGDRPNPGGWDEVEPAVRYGYGARHQYEGREWNDDLERDLANDWAGTGDSSWERVKGAVRRGWDGVKRAVS